MPGRSSPNSNSLRPARMPLPKEHGAWALVYGPLATAALAVGDLGPRLLLLGLATTGIFLAHEPLSRMARAWGREVNPERLSHWRKWLAVFSGTGALFGGLLIPIYQLSLLPVFAVGAGALLALRVFLIFQGKEREVPAELMAVVGLTSTAPIAFYVFQERLDWSAAWLWLLNIFYFSSGIFFVKMTVSRHVGRPEAARRVRDSVAYHALLTPAAAAVGWLAGAPLTAALSVLPATARGLWGAYQPPDNLNLKRIGYREVAFTVIFVAVLGAGWRFS